MANEGVGKYQDGAALRAAVEENGNLLTVTMEDIRRAEGQYGKLGPHVQVKLGQWLANEGMGAFPPNLKRYQYEEIRVYRSGTGMANVVAAVLEPSKNGDTELRKYVSEDSDAQEKLDQIRAIVE